MSKVIDVREGGGELVVLGNAVVLPASTTDGPTQPLDGSIRFNPTGNIVEVYVLGAWGPVAVAPDGTPITFAISQITGLQTALNGKANTVHTHSISDTVNLQATLDGKANTAHTHPTDEIETLDAQLSNLQVGIDTLQSSKADIVHGHSIFDVNGLQQVLDGKAAITHTHTTADISDLRTNIAIFSRCMIDIYVAGTLPLGIVRRFVASGPITIPQNMTGSRGVVTGNPSSTIVLDVKVNGFLSGSISIQGGTSVFSFTTASPLGIVMVAGDILTVEASAASAQISQITINILGAST